MSASLLETLSPQVLQGLRSQRHKLYYHLQVFEDAQTTGESVGERKEDWKSGVHTTFGNEWWRLAVSIIDVVGYGFISLLPYAAECKWE